MAGYLRCNSGEAVVLGNSDIPEGIKLVNVESGDIVDLHDICERHDKVIIDMWTEKCDRCPEAMAKFKDCLPNDEEYAMTICLRYGSIEAVREKSIVGIDGYVVFSDIDRLSIKTLLGDFKSVPYYALVQDRKVVKHSNVVNEVLLPLVLF